MLAQKQPPFKECVIAHWSSDRAPKITGAKTYHRSLGIEYIYGYMRLVEEQCVLGRSRTVRSGGRDTRENAGMSSESGVRNITVECSRFPGEG